MTPQELQDKKEEFIRIYKEHITRPGAEKLLEYLCSEKSDFFTAPASTRYHGAYEGGLLKKDNPEMLSFIYTAPITSLVHLCDREPENQEKIFKRIENFVTHFISVCAED